jgi:hypothetical protein
VEKLILNMVFGVIKRSKTVSSFKNAYRRHRENIVEKHRMA